MFSCEFCEIFKNTFFTEQLWATVSEILSIVQPQLRKRDVLYKDTQVNLGVLLRIWITPWDIKMSQMLNEKTNSVHFHKIRYAGKYVTLGY